MSSTSFTLTYVRPSRLGSRWELCFSISLVSDMRVVGLRLFHVVRFVLLCYAQELGFACLPCIADDGVTFGDASVIVEFFESRCAAS